MDRTDSRKITTVVLMAYFPDNLDKPVPDCLTILDFAAAREPELFRRAKLQSNHSNNTPGQMPFLSSN